MWVEGTLETAVPRRCFFPPSAPAKPCPVAAPISVVTAKLPADAAIATPSESYKAPRQKLGPRKVKDALYTYVRPEETEEPELLGVKSCVFKSIRLSESEAETEDFKAIFAGNKLLWSEDKPNEGIYP